ncbi:hypothetical protein [Lysobacter tyrosinilyticus]
MRTFIACVFLFGLPSLAIAADFSVEDEGLTSVPLAVQRAVLAQSKEPIAGRDDKPCKFIGKPVDLPGSGQKQDWVLTTADACSWAASAAPIWVATRQTNGYSIVLSFLAYDLTLGQQKSHGLRHIALMTATAARTEESLWKFDGTTYQLVRVLGP